MSRVLVGSKIVDDMGREDAFFESRANGLPSEAGDAHIG